VSQPKPESEVLKQNLNSLLDDALGAIEFSDEEEDEFDPNKAYTKAPPKPNVMSDVRTEDGSPVKIAHEETASQEHLGLKKHIYDPHEPHSAQNLGFNSHRLLSQRSRVLEKNTTRSQNFHDETSPYLHFPHRTAGDLIDNHEKNQEDFHVEPNYLDLLAGPEIDDLEDQPSFKLTSVASE